MTVRSFEWVSGVLHMHFGRRSRQPDIRRGRRIIDMTETASGRRVLDELNALLCCAAWTSSTRSDPEGTMREAYSAMRGSDTIEDLRAAAFAVGLVKAVRSYRQMGLA